jgi:hypothetical protein
MDTIAPGQGVCLAGNCFDKSALLTWYDQTNRGYGGTNPMTRQLFTLSEGLAAGRQQERVAEEDFEDGLSPEILRIISQF